MDAGTLPLHPVATPCYGDPVTLGSQDCIPVLQQITDRLDVEVGKHITLVLGLGT